MKIKVITILIIIFSIVCSILSNDYLLGGLTLACGLLNAYYASLSKIYNYVFGALYCLFSGYICYINGLYGIAFLSFTIYFISQVEGYIRWYKKKDKNNEVAIRGFTIKNSILITIICIIGSLVFGYLLSFIPNEKLAFLDASSNIINMCGIVLMNLRYKECWIVWLFNNIFDLWIWIINAINNSPNSIMMLIVSIGYLTINIYGLIKWCKKSKN